jgi:hypothetical protein
MIWKRVLERTFGTPKNFKIAFFTEYLGEKIRIERNGAYNTQG